MKEQWIRDLRKRIHKEKIIVFKGPAKNHTAFQIRATLAPATLPHSNKCLGVARYGSATRE